MAIYLQNNGEQHITVKYFIRQVLPRLAFKGTQLWENTTLCKHHRVSSLSLEYDNHGFELRIITFACTITIRLR